MTMRSRSFFVFFLLVWCLSCLLSACGERENRLIGRWQTDLGGENGLMVVEFSDDGAFLTTFSSNPSLISQGRYRLLEGDMIELITQTPTGSEQTVLMEYKIDDMKLTLSLDGDTQVFYRLED